MQYNIHYVGKMGFLLYIKLQHHAQLPRKANYGKSGHLFMYFHPYCTLYNSKENTFIVITS